MSVAELGRVPKPGARMTVEEFESPGLSEDSSLILVNEVDGGDVLPGFSVVTIAILD